MSVIEALMILYAKEVATSERVSAAINRISGGSLQRDHQHHEAALLSWISHVCAALKKRAVQEIQTGAIDEDVSRSFFMNSRTPKPFSTNSFIFSFYYYYHNRHRVHVCKRPTFRRSVIIAIYATASVWLT